MALIRDIHTEEGARILIWQDKEPLDFFQSKIHLSKKDKDRLTRYTNERRQKDLVISRYLIQSLIPEASIDYKESGKPFLIGSTSKISISHTKDIVAIILHPNKRVAIDIEYLSPRIVKLRNRFLSPAELKVATDIPFYTLFWSAKETLFKLDKNQGLDFKMELAITIDGHQLGGTIRNNSKTIPIHYQLNGNWALTYAIE